MNVTAEIQNKEKSLAELMGRILREPFKPLDDSLKELKDTLLDTQDKISEINDSTNLVAADAESAKKSLMQAFRKMRDEDLPGLTSVLQEHIAEQTQKISSSFDRLTVDLTNQLAALNTMIADDLKESTTDIRLAIAAQRSDAQVAANALSERLEATSVYRRELQQSIADLHGHILSISEAAHAIQAESVQTTLLEIRTNRRLGEKATTDLANQFEAGIRGISTELRDVSTEIDAAMLEQRHTVQTVTELIESSHTALTKTLRQQSAALTAHISASQTKLKTLTNTTVVFFVSVLAYVGYDIWGKFH